MAPHQKKIALCWVKGETGKREGAPEAWRLRLCSWLLQRGSPCLGGALCPHEMGLGGGKVLGLEGTKWTGMRGIAGSTCTNWCVTETALADSCWTDDGKIKWAFAATLTTPWCPQVLQMHLNSDKWWAPIEGAGW